MRWARFGVASAYGLVVFLFYFVTQLGYWTISSSAMLTYTAMLVLVGLVIIMAFLAAGE